MDLPSKALAILQPWASAIIHLGKDIENRSWPTGYRGSVCVHASKPLRQDEIDAFHDTVRLGDIDLTGKPSLFWPDEPRGGIIGVVDIIDCVSHSDSPWFFGEYGFVLANARPVEFIPVKGMLGFFDWKDRLL